MSSTVLQCKCTCMVSSSGWPTPRLICCSMENRERAQESESAVHMDIGLQCGLLFMHTLCFVPLTPAVSEQHTAASCCLLGNEMIMRHGRLGLHWLLTRLQLLNNATPVARLQAGVDGTVLEVRYSGKAHWMDTADRTTLVHPLLSHPPSSGPKLVFSLLGPLLQLDT